MAVSDIEAKHVLCIVPYSAVLWQGNNGFTEDNVRQEMKNLGDLKSTENRVPLLVTLLREYMDPKSAWRPYLDFFPDYSELDQPLTWGSYIMVEELRGTGVNLPIGQALVSLNMEFTTKVLPFINKHPRHFGPEAQDLKMYKTVAGFQMAYSILPRMYESECEDTDDDDDADDDFYFPDAFRPPMMVPVVDIANHKPKTRNNAGIYERKKSVVMCALEPIKKGEEIYFTYGSLSNAELLFRYGFALPYPSNIDEQVKIKFSLVLDTFGKMDGLTLLPEKFDYLTQSVFDEDAEFFIGSSTVGNWNILSTVLEVLYMNAEMFASYSKTQRPRPSEDPDKNEYDRIIYGGKVYPEVTEAWKDLLKRVLKAHMMSMPKTAEKDEAAFKDPQILNELTRRQRYALYVRHGQRKVLQIFMDYLDYGAGSDAVGGNKFLRGSC